MEHSTDFEQEYVPVNSPVIDFYRGKSIFITGSTGFLGTVLVEKLLYTCVDIKTIYILIKQKHGQSIEERVAKFLNSQAFQRLRESSPDFVNKIKPIGGNILEKNLGLNEKDITVLRNEVSVVFHSAANISFNMSMVDAVNTNTRATGELIEICKKMPKLAALVYVSTAYSNCNRSVIDEKVYEMEVPLETVCDMLPHSRSDVLSQLLLDGRPNTYVYSKALSEHLIQRNSAFLPCVIVRPSIIISSLKDPQPGFLSGGNGLCTCLRAAIAGFIKCWNANPSLVLDTIPVDYTANLMIVSAWDINMIRSTGDKNVKVFNCCSGLQNPITFRNLMDTSLEINQKSCKILNNTNPNKIFFIVQNMYLYNILLLFLSIIPAIIIDLTSWLLGRKMRLYKNLQKICKLSNVLRYFTHNHFLFIDNNVRNLYNSLDEQDKNIFDFNVTNIQWERYLTGYVMGLKRLNTI